MSVYVRGKEEERRRREFLETICEIFAPFNVLRIIICYGMLLLSLPYALTNATCHLSEPEAKCSCCQGSSIGTTYRLLSSVILLFVKGMITFWGRGHC